MDIAGKLKGKGGILKYIVLGVIVSVIVAFNIPSKFGVGGGVAAIVALGIAGMVLRKFNGTLGVAAMVAAGLVFGQTYIASRVTSAVSPNSTAPAALTYSQVSDPIVARFR